MYSEYDKLSIVIQHPYNQAILDMDDDFRKKLHMTVFIYVKSSDYILYYLHLLIFS